MSKDKRSEIVSEIQTLEAVGGNSTDIQLLKYEYEKFDSESQPYELTLVSEGKFQMIHMEGLTNATVMFEMYKRIGKGMGIDFLLLTDARGRKKRSQLLK